MGLFIGVQWIHCRSINALIGCVVGGLRAIVRVAHCVMKYLAFTKYPSLRDVSTLKFRIEYLPRPPSYIPYLQQQLTFWIELDLEGTLPSASQGTSRILCYPMLQGSITDTWNSTCCPRQRIESYLVGTFNAFKLFRNLSVACRS